MRRLDHETADHIAATQVSAALLRAPTCLGRTVEATISTLFDGGLIDVTLARYVTLNADRFCTLAQPPYFEAKWHLLADSLQGAAKTSSAHPFPQQSS
jgi:hypothetical protein